MKYYNLSKNKVLEKLNTTDKGLSNGEVIKRLEKYGKNEFNKEPKRSIIKMAFDEIKNPITIILIIASLSSLISRDYYECIAIISIVILNVTLGVTQELKALKKTDALKELIKYKTKVIRDGKEIMVLSSELVPGDIALLESGNKIGADMRILETKNLSIDESVLTGESTGVTKTSNMLKGNIAISSQNNIVFAGTVVLRGRAKAVVIKTGTYTEVGQISDAVTQMEEELSPLTIRVNKLSKQISFLIIVVGLIITLLLYAKNMPGKEIFLSVIALSVSAMPESLPLALTLALTVSSTRMSKKNVIVKKLNSVEALGSCTVIASDKTGTLTLNEQTAKKIVLPSSEEVEITGVGYNNEGIVKTNNKNKKEVDNVIKQGVINNEGQLMLEHNKYTYFGDTIDVAFLALGLKNKVKYNFEVISEIPYESENKFSAALYKENNNNYLTVKGSLEKVLTFSSKMTISGKEVPIDKEKLIKQNSKLASEGYRVIALAESKVNINELKTEKDIPDLSFSGFVCFIDPIRKEASKSVNECKTAGIKVVMITGDHPLTAANIAKELNLIKEENEVATPAEVNEYLKKGEKAFDNFVKEKSVFARVTPLEKLAIVESYKRQGEFIAVTGDGVNDAPAIKSANIGIAMGSGTDVAKETADMIILDDDFNSIVEGVKQGRVAYSNIRKIVYLLLSCGAGEVLFFILAIAANLPIPLIAIQLLWLNIVTDGLQDIALSFEKGEDEILKEEITSPESAIFNNDLFFEVLVSGLIIGLTVYGFWVYLMSKNINITLARTYIMTLMVFMQNIHVLNCRSEKRSTFKVPFDNKFLALSIIGALILQIIVMKFDIFAKFLQITDIPTSHLLGLFIMSIPLLLIMEIYKKIIYNKK